MTASFVSFGSLYDTVDRFLDGSRKAEHISSGQLEYSQGLLVATDLVHIRGALSSV